MQEMYEALEKLYGKMGRFYKEGAVIFLENDPGREMFFILEGTVEITKTYKEMEIFGGTKLHLGSNTRVLGTLTRGDFFGEMALINDKERSATAMALTDLKVIVITKETFESVVKQSNDLLLQILRSLSNRIREGNRYIRLTPEELENLRRLTRGHSAEYKTDSTEIKEQPAAANDSVDEKRVVCLYCKAQIKERDIYCWRCGNKVYVQGLDEDPLPDNE